MFNLFRSRESSVRYILGAMLILVALSMVITLVPGYGGGWGGGSSGDPTLIAEVGDERVTVQDVRQAISRELKSGQIPKGMEQVYVPMFIDEIIASKAEAFQASRMGLRVTDEQLAENIRSMIPQLFENGKFVGNGAYASVLAGQNMTIAQFETNVRQATLQARLQAVALEGLVVTPAEVEREFRLRNEKAKLGYVAVRPDALKSKINPTPADLQAYFEGHRASFMVPEKRSYLIYPIDQAKIAAGLQLPEPELRKAYLAGIEQFRTQERVKASHILVATKDKTPAEVGALQKKAEDLLKQVRGGGNFAELAKKNSEDPGSGSKGGELGFLTKGQTVPEFEKALFAGKVGEIVGPVKTQFGFHIIKIEEHEQARVKPFEEVKNELAGELARGQVIEKMQAAADQIRSALVKGQAEADKVAATFGVVAVKAEKAGPNDPVQEVGVNASFNEGAAKLPKNGVTSVIQVSPAKLVVARVTDVFASHPAEFADVEKQVKDLVLDEKAQAMAKSQIDEMTAKLKAPGADLAAIAKSYGYEYKVSEMVTRAGAITGVGPANMFSALFSKNVGETDGPVRSFDGVYFAKLVEKEAADLTQLAAQRVGMLEAIKSARARERAQLMRDGILRELVKSKKVKIYSENIKKLAAAFAKS